MRYEVVVTPAAGRDLRKLPAQARDALLLRLRSLRDEPRPADAKKLSSSQNLWRIRMDEYRLLYQIRDEALLVLAVRAGHRKDVYRQLFRLVKTTRK